VDAFKAAQTEKLALARHLHERLAEIDAIDPGPEPELSVVAFRHRDGDEAGERLLAHLQQEGRIMLSGTRVDGSFRLRAAILCFRTHVEHVDIAIEAVRDGVAAIHG
jgi:glutamate/tyrosine decarboxylase-like PLP-dependent enzyme